MFDKKTKLIAQDEPLNEAAAALAAGKLVSFPTETVYGLGANAFNAKAVRAIFKAKSRPADNPLIVHISDIKMLEDLVTEVPDFARALMDKFWPGPLTFVMKKTKAVPKIVTAGLDTVAVRFPSHPIALALLRLAKVPVAAPSANISGKPSPTSAADVVEDLKGRVEFIIDGGPSEFGLESTVLDVTVFPPEILRPGSVTFEQIELQLEISGFSLHNENRPRLSAEGARSNAEGAEPPKTEAAPKAPGMKYRHYAPKADMTLLCGDTLSVVKEIMRRAAGDVADGQRPGIMATDQTKVFYFSKGPKVICLGDREHPVTIAARLFAALRRFDRNQVAHIYAEGVDRESIGDAIMNRLSKAADNIVDIPTTPFRILFVCTGNTCRSSMAEGIMKKLAQDSGLNIEISSAGANANDGDSASDHAVLALQQLFGIDISSHTARHLTPEILDAADLVLTMEGRHHDFIAHYVPEQSFKTAVLTMFVGNDASGVSDPYGGDLEVYKMTAAQIFTELTKLSNILLFHKSDE